MHVLDQRMTERLPEFAANARIPLEWLRRSAVDVLGVAELAWLRAYRRHTRDGLILSGQCPQLMDKLYAIGGCLIRNEIDARVWTAQEVVEAAKQGEAPSFTVLLIPNVYAPTGSESAGLSQYDAQQLLRVLMQRGARSLKTIMYVSDPKGLEKSYGPVMTAFLRQNYTRLTAEV